MFFSYNFCYHASISSRMLAGLPLACLALSLVAPAAVERGSQGLSVLNGSTERAPVVTSSSAQSMLPCMLRRAAYASSQGLCPLQHAAVVCQAAGAIPPLALLHPPSLAFC